MQNYDRILYISCNPHTLCENLQTLSQTHRIEKAALFDQFPYTDHMESGVVAVKKIKITAAESGTLPELTALCAPLGIEHCTESPLALVQTETHLALRKLDEPKLGDVFVDFVAGAMAHRRKLAVDVAKLLLKL